jgi:hypothetical protein
MLLAQRALHPEHNPVQQSKALLRLARTDEVQITVGWEDRWQTLSENHLPRIIAIFIQENPEIIRLSGGSSHSGGDMKTRALLEALLCALAAISPIDQHNISSQVWEFRFKDTVVLRRHHYSSGRVGQINQEAISTRIRKGKKGGKAEMEQENPRIHAQF